MAKKTEAPKIEYEREYIVPLRRGWLKVPEYKRANKAVKTLKEFIARHMKVYDRDLRKVKVETDLNNEIRFRGMTKPPAKIRVRAKRFDNDTVSVELVDLPEHIKFKRIREEEKNKDVKKTLKIKPKDKKDLDKPIEITKSNSVPANNEGSSKPLVKNKKDNKKKEMTKKAKK